METIFGLTMEQIVTLIVGVIIVIFIVIKYVSSKTGKELNVLEYLDTIKDVLDQIVTEANEIEKLSGNKYETVDEYREALLKTAIARFKTMGETLGIDIDIINKIPDDVLASVLNSIIGKFIEDTDVSPMLITEEDTQEIKEEPVSEIEDSNIIMLSTSEYAKKYNMTVREVADACKNGQLKATKISGKWRIEDTLEVDEKVEQIPVNKDIQNAIETFNDDDHMNEGWL